MNGPPVLIEPVANTFTAADISWELAPVATTPTDDPLVQAITEALTYRVLAQQALHYLYPLEEAVERLEKRLYQVLDENRALRKEQRMRSGATT